MGTFQHNGGRACCCSIRWRGVGERNERLSAEQPAASSMMMSFFLSPRKRANRKLMKKFNSRHPADSHGCHHRGRYHHYSYCALLQYHSNDKVKFAPIAFPSSNGRNQSVDLSLFLHRTELRACAASPARGSWSIWRRKTVP